MSNLQIINDKKFQGTAKRLDDIDLPRIGSRIKVGEDELHAFLEVESRGSGFDDYGRPKILFEPHVFYDLLTEPQRSTAVKQGLAYEKWGTKKYPTDSYPRLFAAMKINPDAALQSCSWGMTQIMGRNYKMIGYSNVYDMVFDFMQDEENHVDKCVTFLIKTGADKYLRAHNWAKVAEIYNGKGYKKNQYDTKMKKAFDKWQKIPDTPYDNLRNYLIDKNETNDPNAIINVKVDDPDADTVIEAWISPPIKKGSKPPQDYLTKPQIEYIQRRLHELGYVIVGKIDGKYGTTTKAAVTALEDTMGIPSNGGNYSAAIGKALAINDGSNKYKVPEARKNTTLKDLRAQGCKTVKATDGIKASSVVGASGLGLMSVGSAVVDYAPNAMSWVAPIREFFSEWPLWVFGILALVFCFVMWYKATQAANARLFDEQTGRNVGNPDPSPSPPVTVIDENAELPQAVPNFLKREDEEHQEIDVVGGPR